MSKFKKFIFFLAVLFFIVIGTKYYWCPSTPKHYFHSKNYCPFCDPKVLDNQKFYEDDKVIGLYNHRPSLPGHCLIVSKRHIERFELATNEELLRMIKLIKKINEAVSKAYGTDAYLILQKNGYSMGQTVPHIHFHYLPRKNEELFPLTLLFKFIWPSLRKAIDSEELKKNIMKIKAVLTT